MKHCFTCISSLLLVAFHVASAQTIRYVKPGTTGTGLSWTVASGDLAQMLQLSNPGDEVWVAAGSFAPQRDASGSLTPSDSRNKTFFIKSGVKVYGGFVGNETSLNQRPSVNPATTPSSTTLTGDIGITGNSTDNAYHVVSIGASTASIILDGFVIMRGNANGPSTGVFTGDQYGGGLLVLSNEAATVQPLLQNLVIRENQAASGGGGLFASSVGVVSGFTPITGTSSPRIQNCQFILNQAQTGGGLLLYGAGQPSLQNLLFDRNTATESGGGASLMGADPDGRNGRLYLPTLNRCDFSNNSAPLGGGLVGQTESGEVALTITRCSFQNNKAENLSGGFFGIGPSGAGIFLGSLNSSPTINTTLQNCLITSNNADDMGGGIYLNPGCNLTVANNTISGNSAYRGGAIAGQPNVGNQLDLSNSILFDNVGLAGNPTLYIYNYELSGNTVDLTNNSFLSSYLHLSSSDVQSCSAIWGCSTTPGNFDESPIFSSPGTYTLQANSPCVNAGNPSSTTATTGSVDFAGNTRIQGSIVDVGALESSFPLTTVYTIQSGLFEEATNWSCLCSPTGKKTVVGHIMSMPSGASIQSVRFRPGGRIQMTSGASGNPSRIQFSTGIQP